MVTIYDVFQVIYDYRSPIRPVEVVELLKRGKELVRAEKEGEVVMLRSGNSLVPWSTIRQLDIPQASKNKEGLVKFVSDSLTF